MKDMTKEQFIDLMTMIQDHDSLMHSISKYIETFSSSYVVLESKFSYKFG